MIEEKIAEEGKKESRQAELVRLIQRNFYMSVEEIASLFAVTTQTARRDIMALEEAGRVRRLHGGAAIAAPVYPAVYRQRRIENALQKERVGRMVADLIPDGSAIFVDAGTTCEAVARALLRRQNLRVVTYSLRVATILSEQASFTVAVPGGFVRPVDGGVFQEETGNFIRRFKFDTAIISTSGIDDEGDMCDDDHAEVAAVSAALAQAQRKILAVDSSKFGRRAMVRVGTIADIDILVTDARPQGDVLRVIEEAGVELVC